MLPYITKDQAVRIAKEYGGSGSGSGSSDVVVYKFNMDLTDVEWPVEMPKKIDDDTLPKFDEVLDELKSGKVVYISGNLNNISFGSEATVSLSGSCLISTTPFPKQMVDPSDSGYLAVPVGCFNFGTVGDGSIPVALICYPADIVTPEITIEKDRWYIQCVAL